MKPCVLRKEHYRKIHANFEHGEKRSLTHGTKIHILQILISYKELGHFDKYIDTLS